MGHSKVQIKLVPFLSFLSLSFLAAQLLRWLVPLQQLQEHFLQVLAPLTVDLEDRRLEEHHRHRLHRLPQADSPGLGGQVSAFP